MVLFLLSGALHGNLLDRAAHPTTASPLVFVTCLPFLIVDARTNRLCFDDRWSGFAAARSQLIPKKNYLLIRGERLKVGWEGMAFEDGKV